MKIKKTFQGSLPENKILNSNSTSQIDTYSCDYINKLDVNLIQGEIENGVVLWENPSPLNDFAPQTLDLDLSNYSTIKVWYKHYKESDTLLFVETKPGCNIPLNYSSMVISDTDSNNANFEKDNRYMNTTTSSITFDKGKLYLSHTNKFTIDNGRCVPVKIIGYKDTMPAVVVKEKTEEIYSTEEVRIGKWIDGKPIYRKVFTGTTNGSDNTIITKTTLNIDKLTNSSGILYNSAVQINIGKSESIGNTNGNTRVWINNGNVVLTVGSDLTTGFSYIAVLEYTKTTD